MPVTVTIWKRNLQHVDFRTGRWVMVGRPSWWNFIMSGMCGPKAYFQSSFPFIRIERSQVKSTSYIVVGVAPEDLKWPPGWEWFKGFLGQRVLK